MKVNKKAIIGIALCLISWFTAYSDAISDLLK